MAMANSNEERREGDEPLVDHLAHVHEAVDNSRRGGPDLLPEVLGHRARHGISRADPWKDADNWQVRDYGRA